MVEAGCSPEASLMELYVSEEVSDDWRNCAKIGLWKQLRGHSTTSQYGQLTRGELSAGEDTRELFLKVMDEIKSGKFSREWALEQKNGMKVYDSLVKRSLAHRINQVEEDIRKILNHGKESGK
jgi:ketol-acid reductoisomerase